MNDNRDVAVQISNLKKKYRLGVIGGGTLQGDLQSWWAKKRGKEDPNLKIGQKEYGKNETFMALNGIDLTVKKGERLGIIGHNGAGKSTLLKLLSRVTAPTEGRICIDGHVSSMLEVGTGFNPELTGRENIYLNGAILGMSKAEVDSKIDEIIEFSECGQFIDTPVKRYSSGMYVKLAFSVAAHLDSEILIMDEVLAVGDMKFQQKCLEKMSDVSKTEGKTVLYVSHNMNTIRTLCDRCIVLEHGKKIYDGDVETAIGLYSDIHQRNQSKHVFVEDLSMVQNETVKVCEACFIDNNKCVFQTDEKMKFGLKIFSAKEINNVHFRLILKLLDDTVVGIAFSKDFSLKSGLNDLTCIFKMDGIPPFNYMFNIIVSQTDGFGTVERLDVVESVLDFSIIPAERYCNNIEWGIKQWGYHKYEDICIECNAG